MKPSDWPKRNRPSVNSKSGIIRRVGRVSKQKGQAMIELALLLPLILLLLIGIIEIGRLAYYYIEVADAARAGAQYASQSLANAANTNIPNITQAVQNDFQDIGAIALSPPPTQACGCPGVAAGACPASGCSYPLVYVTVSTTYRLNPLFQYPGISTLFPVTITGNSTMPVRQ